MRKKGWWPQFSLKAQFWLAPEKGREDDIYLEEIPANAIRGEIEAHNAYSLTDNKWSEIVIRLPLELSKTKVEFIIIPKAG